MARLKLSTSKDPTELKVQRDQLIEHSRNNPKERSQRLKPRSQSVDTDTSAQNEEAAPLLTLSDIQISPDALEAINQKGLDTLKESSPSTNSSFQLSDPQNSPTTVTNEIDTLVNPVNNVSNAQIPPPR